MKVPGCISVYLYMSDGDWGLVGETTDPEPRISHYWKGRQTVPTPDERAAALKSLGYEVVTAWVWRESSVETAAHSLYAASYVKPTVEPSVRYPNPQKASV